MSFGMLESRAVSGMLGDMLSRIPHAGVVIALCLWAFGLALVGARLVELSRLDAVDELVRKVAQGVSPLVPDFSGLPASGESGCRMYPVIQRFTLHGLTIADTGRVLTPLEAYRMTSATAEMVAPLFLGLLTSSLVWSLVVMRGRGGAIARSRPLPTVMLLSLLIATPFFLAASALYWPIVSFWGTVAFDFVATRGLNHPPVDSDLTRIAIGAGLWSLCSCVSISMLRRTLTRAGHSSGTERSESAKEDASWWAVESGSVGFGARLWRATRGTVIAVVIIGLLCSPLVGGVMSRVMG